MCQRLTLFLRGWCGFNYLLSQIVNKKLLDEEPLGESTNGIRLMPDASFSF
jgi:hypothetical protein